MPAFKALMTKKKSHSLSNHTEKMGLALSIKYYKIL